MVPYHPCLDTMTVFEERLSLLLIENCISILEFLFLGNNQYVMDEQRLTSYSLLMIITSIT